MVLRIFDKRDADTSPLHSFVTDPDCKGARQHAITKVDNELMDLCQFLGKLSWLQSAFCSGKHNCHVHTSCLQALVLHHLLNIILHTVKADPCRSSNAING